MHSSTEPVEAGDPPADKVDMSRRGCRRDGEASRERILLTALRLFAAQGFKNTSTREIAKAAQVNIAALNYYFGDKAGLYRAAFTLFSPSRPDAAVQHGPNGFSRPGIPLPQAMHELFRELLPPLASSQEFQWGLRLLFRELTEPTGLWQEEVDQGIKPLHNALTRLLCREFNRVRPDADIERLAFCIVSMPVHFVVWHDVVVQIAPQLLGNEAAVQALTDRIATYACDMVHAEARRRESQA